MADPDRNKSLLVTGQLSHGCTNLSLAWPHGGVGLGLVGSMYFDPPAGVIRLTAEETNGTQALLYVGGDAIFGARVEGWDDTVAGGVLAPLFPARREVSSRVVLEWPGDATAATAVVASGGRTLTFAASGRTITASSGSFVTNGYEVGMTLTVTGTTSNNATFKLTSVTATVLTVAQVLVNEGPLSSAATLNATTLRPGGIVPALEPLVFTPINAAHPAVIVYRAAPLVELSAQLRLSSIRTLSVPLVFVGTPDSTGRVAAMGRLADLEL